MVGESIIVKSKVKLAEHPSASTTDNVYGFPGVEGIDSPPNTGPDLGPTVVVPFGYVSVYLLNKI